MKNKLYVIIAAMGLLSGFYACDKVKDGDYYKPAQAGNRKVFLEDYTGHLCGNCPDAAREAKALKTTYGDNLVIMSVHPKCVFSVLQPPDFTYDFRTPEGNSLDSTFKVSDAGLPRGMVNRKVYKDSRILSFGDWGASIAQLVSIPEDVIITLKANLNSSTKQIDVSNKVVFQKALAGKYNLVVYLTEDSIVQPQKDYSNNPEVVKDYVHRHVLRTTAEGPFGKQIATITHPQDSAKAVYHIPVNTVWNTQRLNIVTLVIDAVSNEVIGVNETHVQ